MAGLGSRKGESWRAAALAGVVGIFSITNPVALLLLASAVVALAFGARDGRVVLVAAVGAGIAVWATAGSSLVWIHRGWPLALAGAYVLLRVNRPEWPLTAHALGAVALAAGLAALIFAIWPEGWWQVDTQVVATFRRRADAALAAGLDPALRRQLEGPIRFAFRWTAALFPAWLGIASMAALGLAEFFRAKLGGSGEIALGPLREFRFNDQWVWLWILGLALLIVPAGAAIHRVGANAALLFGSLYVLRGLGVVVAAPGGRWGLT